MKKIIKTIILICVVTFSLFSALTPVFAENTQNNNQTKQEVKSDSKPSNNTTTLDTSLNFSSFSKLIDEEVTGISADIKEKAAKPEVNGFVYEFPVLRNGDVVSDDIYSKYSSGEYSAKVFAYYALRDGWQYEAVVGALAYMYAEGMGVDGSFTYEGCWSTKGPSGISHDKTLNNDAWRQWINSSDCASQMISSTSWYSDSHYATGLGYCGESSVWNNRVKTLDLCDKYLDAADEAGVAWQDINFQTQHALEFLTSPATQNDPDWKDPKTYEGDAREYCARMFAAIAYSGYSLWYDNGQLQAHLDKVSVVRPFVDEVIAGYDFGIEDFD